MSFGESFRPSVGFLRSLMSIEADDAEQAPLDPKLRRAGIFDATCGFLRATSEARPTHSVEDAHWTDQATGEFLTLMVELAASPILLCVTHRTGYPLPVRRTRLART